MLYETVYVYYKDCRIKEDEYGHASPMRDLRNAYKTLE
jgi:hypothetical protein